MARLLAKTPEGADAASLSTKYLASYGTELRYEGKFKDFLRRLEMSNVLRLEWRGKVLYVKPGGGSGRRTNPRTPCITFAAEGSCRFGDTCRYTHGAAEPSGAGKRAPALCTNFAADGSCRFGDTCRYTHGAANTSATAAATDGPSRAAVSAGAAMVKKATVTCCVCFDDFALADGLSCRRISADAGTAEEAHFLCSDCLAGHVAAACDEESLRLFVDRGGVRCPDPDCQSPRLSDKALALALSEESFAKYTLAKEKVAEQRINAELEGDFERRIEQMRKDFGSAADDAALRRRLHVVDKVLNLACPRCNQVFVDFSGCCALTCSRAGCGAGFCAHCLADCGSDAHQHVQSCMVGRGEFYVSEQTFHEGQNLRRKRMLGEYLGTLSATEAEQVLNDCKKDMLDLGLDPKVVC